MSAPTYVLVPGAGGAASYWHLVQRELDARQLASIAVGLPAGDDSKGLSEYVDVVVDAAVGLDDIVLVAQSLGGFTASLAADKLPTSRLVLLNAMIPVPGESAGEWWAATGSSQAMRQSDIRDGRDPDGEFDLDVYFLHDVPAAALEADDQSEQSDAIFATPWTLSAWPDVSTTVLAARDDRFFPYEFQQRVARERLGLDVVEVPGGHLAALSYPVEVTEAIVAT